MTVTPQPSNQLPIPPSLEDSWIAQAIIGLLVGLVLLRYILTIIEPIADFFKPDEKEKPVIVIGEKANPYDTIYNQTALLLKVQNDTIAQMQMNITRLTDENAQLREKLEEKEQEQDE